MKNLDAVFAGGPLAVNVLNERYLRRNERGETIESPSEMFERVARFIGAADARYGEDPEESIPEFYSLMARADFEPNTPCLVNAGVSSSSGMFSACFVLPVPDSVEGVFTTLAHMALIHRSGGGTGFSFSDLRPAGDLVRGRQGVAGGPVGFMSAYNSVSDVVKQSGVRHGANMGILRVDHPDVFDFIHCKRRPCASCADFGASSCDHSVRNFNISVALTDAFMAAWEHDGEYELVNPRSGAPVRKLPAREVWRWIVENAWHSGEPGAFFIDRVNALDPLSKHLGPVKATNPCGEIPLRDYDSCTLGSINLGRFYVERAGRGAIDYDRLQQVVRRAVHFLDNVLTVNTYPLREVDEVTTRSRKIGLGVMGWADLLLKLGVPYASEAALALAHKVMGFVNSSAVRASEELAEQRGPFPWWAQSRWAERGDKPRRNSTVTGIAPTGTISIIAGCNFGIEPLFALSMVRRQAGMIQRDFNQEFVNLARRQGWYREATMERVASSGTCQGVPGVPLEVQELFKVAGEISVDWHVRTQAAFQAHTEDAVSKTINLPVDSGRSDVESAYALAWKLGCKGITVYRDGSRKRQVLNAGAREMARPSLHRSRSDDRSSSKADATGSERARRGVCPGCQQPTLIKASRCDLCQTCSFSSC